MCDFGGFKRNGRVSRPIKTLRSLLTDAKTPAPGRVAAEGEKKNRVVGGLGRGRPGGRLFGRRLCSCGTKSGRDEKEVSKNQKKECRAPGFSQENLREQRGYPEGRWETIEGRSNSKEMRKANVTERGEKRKVLT
jgi:hypothetical protein